MRTEFLLYFIFSFSAYTTMCQSHRCDDIFSNLSEIARSSNEHGLQLFDTLSGKYIFSTGEIKRAIKVQKNSASIEIQPFNPFTKEEQFMFKMAITCEENEFCIKIDSVMKTPAYFKNLNTVEVNESNADSLGYYYSYMLLTTREEQWIWKIQSAVRSLQANGTFFLMIDLLRDLHLVAFKNYNELYVGDALRQRSYCPNSGKK